MKDEVLEENPLWYRDAIIYELHVRSFFDSKADGVGDFPGLTSKLDYLQDLGVTALWLLPFYPSPLKDDGYDIADYTAIHPDYGTLRDFKEFLREAHRRGLRVITELVLNHTSDQCGWFQRARRAPPGSPEREFYVWSNTRERYRDARIIFKDFEQSNWTWDPTAGAYYWHRFYSHQPDLNYENPAVRKAMLQVLDFWLGMGVDGLRLDAVPYLFEREGTSCENLPETHAFLKDLRAHVDRRHKGCMLLGEANQWPEDAVAYFGSGDECHMTFHFPLMPRLFMAVRREDRFPILDILDQTPALPEICQWAAFLRNHDELTLEMVTDEERDYMYKVYAGDPRARINLGIRRRLAPLLGNDRRRIELMNGLLLSLVGTPVIYYGDEIGMGDNFYLGDRNGVRTPLQWSADRNAGFSRANPQQLFLPVVIDSEYHYETVNIEAQQKNPHSLLWWMKRLISLRKRFGAFGRGSVEFLLPENRKVLAFLRRHEDETLLVVANLSRFVQYVELDLAAFRGWTPVELFGHAAFPAVSERPYSLSLGPHGFYWFKLEHEQAAAAQAAGHTVTLPSVKVTAGWKEVLAGEGKGAFEEAARTFLQGKRWFQGKGRLTGVKVADVVPLNHGLAGAVVAIVEVGHADGDPGTYVVPLAWAAGNDAPATLGEQQQAVLCRVETKNGKEGIIYDAAVRKELGVDLLQAFIQRRRFKGLRGELVAIVPEASRRALPKEATGLEPSVARGEQSNTSILYGNRYLLKLLRRVESGVHPEVEVGAFLGSQGFEHAPVLHGYLEYQPESGPPVLVGVLKAFIPNHGDAWEYTLDALGRYFERALSQTALAPGAREARSFLELAGSEPPPALADLLGAYPAMASLLGQRTAELHRALSSSTDDPAFAPEPFTPHARRSFYQSLRNLAHRVFGQLARDLPELPEQARAEGERVLALKDEIARRFRAVIEWQLGSPRIRCHGDYHLGQVLFTGKDFVITDFEGEVNRSLGERRMKSSALRDAAGMLRSFHYAAHHALRAGSVRPEDRARLEPWAQLWQAWVSAAFLRGYLEAAAGGRFLPAEREELSFLLQMHLVEKAIYEIGYELGSRKDWVRIPLEGVLDLVAPKA